MATVKLTSMHIKKKLMLTKSGTSRGKCKQKKKKSLYCAPTLTANKQEADNYKSKTDTQTQTHSQTNSHSHTSRHFMDQFPMVTTKMCIWSSLSPQTLWLTVNPTWGGPQQVQSANSSVAVLPQWSLLPRTSLNWFPQSWELPVLCEHVISNMDTEVFVWSLSSTLIMTFDLIMVHKVSCPLKTTTTVMAYLLPTHHKVVGETGCLCSSSMSWSMTHSSVSFLCAVPHLARKDSLVGAIQLCIHEWQ